MKTIVFPAGREKEPLQIVRKRRESPFFDTKVGISRNPGSLAAACACIRIAKSLVRLIVCWVAAGPLHFERREAVESSFRGPPATSPKHKPFDQKLLATRYKG